jgi:hypothetical protein
LSFLVAFDLRGTVTLALSPARRSGTKNIPSPVLARNGTDHE